VSPQDREIECLGLRGISPAAPKIFTGFGCMVRGANWGPSQYS